METATTGGHGADPVDKAQAQGEQVAHSRSFEWFARAGLAARGLIYVIIGVLAIKVAVGAGGSTESQQGALQEIAQQPFGKWLLILTAIGLAGYAVWRLVRAGIGHGPESGDDSAFDRIGGVVSGLAYGGLCITAITIVAGSGGSSGGGSSSSTGGVLDWPAGTLIVAIAGLIVIGVGLEQLYKGVSEKFLEKSKTDEMSEGVKRTFSTLGTFGHVARCVVFVLIGYFLFMAAIDYDPNAPVSLDGALTTLSQASYGRYLLGLVAAGLIGFGLYSFADARYRKV